MKFRPRLLIAALGLIAPCVIVAENMPTTLKNRPAPEPTPFDRPVETLKSLYLSTDPAGSPLDKEEDETLRAVLKPVFENNDKKAKLAYGRNYRHLPPTVQFAFDLRFKNFSHAQQVLKESRKSSDEKAAWSDFVNTQPSDVGSALCELFKSGKIWPFEKSEDERAKNAHWVASAEKYLDLLGEKRNLSAASKAIDEALKSLDCTETKKIWNKECPNLSPERQQSLFNEGFFDQLRNAQRRSSYYHQVHRKNESKLALDPDSFARVPMMGLYGALLSTNFGQRNHFHRRLRGIAKDMRPDSLNRRIIAAVILEDDKDLIFAKRMKQFVHTYPFVSIVNNLETKLSTCAIPEVKSWRPPR